MLASSKTWAWKPVVPVFCLLNVSKPAWIPRDGTPPGVWRDLSSLLCCRGVCMCMCVFAHVCTSLHRMSNILFNCFVSCFKTVFFLIWARVIKSVSQTFEADKSKKLFVFARHEAEDLMASQAPCRRG